MLTLTRVFHALHRYGTASAAEVALSIGVPQTTAARALAALQKVRKARKVGGGRTTRWQLVQGATAPTDRRGKMPGSALARELSPSRPPERQAKARAKLHAKKPRVAPHQIEPPAWADLAAAFAKKPLENRGNEEYSESRHLARP